MKVKEGPRAESAPEAPRDRPAARPVNAWLLIASLFFVSLAWGPSAAHLLELPAKIDLGPDAYLTVQQIYRGWALLGFVVFGALVSTAGFAWTSRRRPWLGLAVSAFLCIAGTQVVFWTLTAPANQATENWTDLPAAWDDVRRTWEYSHALSAALNLTALGLLLLAALRMLRHEGTDSRSGVTVGRQGRRHAPQPPPHETAQVADTG